jgi:hypothetical protein
MHRHHRATWSRDLTPTALRQAKAAQNRQQSGLAKLILGW